MLASSELSTLLICDVFMQTLLDVFAFNLHVSWTWVAFNDVSQSSISKTADLNRSPWTTRRPIKIMKSLKALSWSLIFLFVHLRALLKFRGLLIFSACQEFCKLKKISNEKKTEENSSFLPHIHEKLIRLSEAPDD